MQTKKQLLKKAKEFNRVISKIEAKIDNLRGQKMSKEIKRELSLFLEKKDDFVNALGRILREIECVNFPQNKIRNSYRKDVMTVFNEALHENVLFIRYLGGYTPKKQPIESLKIAKTVYP